MEDTANPWENAASDQDWSRRNPSEEPKTEIPSYEESPKEEELGSKIVRSLINTCHFFDILLGLAFLIYGIVLRMERKAAKFFFVVSISLGGVLIFRASVGTFSIYRDQYKRFGLKISACLSILMSFMFFVTSMISLGERRKVMEYLIEQKQELHLPDNFVVFLKNNIHFIWISLLVTCALEIIRWVSVLNYREYLLEDDELSVQLLLQTPIRNRKPWWWKRQNMASTQAEELNDPLLGPSWTVSNNNSYHMDEGLDQANNGNSLWSKLFARRSGSNSRDDTSVDFASVQEDWASKSEEDPLWWTRDEGGKQK